MAYAPWDDGLPFSTVNINGGPTVLAVWGLIVASKDQDGITNLNPASIVGLWSNSLEPKPLEAVQAAWDYLCAPDPLSKNRDEGGRRIVPTGDGRWRVVSHEKYREKYRAEKRKRQLAEASKRYRDKQGDGSSGGAAELGGSQEQQLSVVVKGREHGFDPQPSLDPVAGAAAARPLPTEPRVHIVRGDQRIPVEQAFVPSPQYPTEADRRAANSEAGELCQWLEARCGRTTGEVFRHAADYPNAQGFKARADMCTPARLEQTLLTLREWKRRCEGFRCSPDQSWSLKPKPGESAPKRDNLSIAADELRAEMEARRADLGASRGAGDAVAAGRLALSHGEQGGQ